MNTRPATRECAQMPRIELLQRARILRSRQSQRYGHPAKPAGDYGPHRYRLLIHSTRTGLRCSRSSAGASFQRPGSRRSSTSRFETRPAAERREDVGAGLMSLRYDGLRTEPPTSINSGCRPEQENSPDLPASPPPARGDSPASTVDGPRGRQLAEGETPAWGNPWSVSKRLSCTRRLLSLGALIA